MVAMLQSESRSSRRRRKGDNVEGRVGGEGASSRREDEEQEEDGVGAWRPSSRTLKWPHGTTTSMACLLLTVVAISGCVQVAVAEGNIGCLFAQSLCMDDLEFCYDDFAFGKCVPRFGNDPDDLARSRLSMSQSKVLATMLQEMQGAGLTWDHPFVQCRIQGALFALREKSPMPPNLCGHLAPDPEILGPQSPMAYVRFTPPLDEDDYPNDVDFYSPVKKSFQPKAWERKPESPSNLWLATDPEEAELMRELRLRELMRAAEEKARQEEDPIVPIINGESFFTERQRQLESEALNDVLQELAAEEQEQQQQLERVEELQEKKRVGANDMPHTSFREVSRVEHIPAVSYYREPHQIFEDSDWENEDSIPSGSVYINDPQRQRQSDSEPEEVEEILPVDAVIPAEAAGGIYTEGGMVYLPGQEKPENGDEQESSDRDEARDLLANMLGFTRHERLDVKKPGPLVVPPETSNDATPKPTPTTKEILPANIVDTPKAKKLVIEGHQTDDHGLHSVDAQYAHVKFTTPVDNWRDGERIVQAIGEQLNLPTALTHIRVDQHEVSFRVDANAEKKTATDVAKAINDPRFKSNLSRRLGVNVLYAGIGDKTQASEWTHLMSRKAVSMTQEGGIDSTHLMVYMFVGAGVAAIVVAVITLFVIKRHDKVKSKLGGLQGGMGGGGVDSSKDYQELCRARMAGKGAGTDTATSGRITSLTKENERPPSSRSSTSSWSEEPMTNMDISTGHMVLSYMEDHLRNKGRLQREWEALCRYEAEPNSRDAGLQEQTEKLNRDGAPLPFDHSRVVLNHLANAEGLDYINASTITDHDPRAPAYVAAQGPMQSTVAHFWQMIWEQGTVVIVALCRLQENGEISCTRYWPEEGAETYHIYEVHLVSEHIWCDDYLVRSFYLKNLQTGETRTVTQFHFLTWPQMGVPASAKPLLEFRRKVNKSYRGRSCPIVVHSGNGAGRTGAYILLDLVLGRMNKGAREIDIAATLEHLRDQRAGLVETRPQFEFVLMAVAEEVHAILKALPNTTSTEKRDIDKDPIKEEEKVQQKKDDEKKEERKGSGGGEEKKVTEKVTEEKGKEGKEAKK